MSYPLYEHDGFEYIETKGGPENLLLLHGLFGALSNFGEIVDYFGDKYNVLVPLLPIMKLPLRKVSVSGLVNHVAQFVDFKGFDKVHVLGNSLGGHVALLYALAHQDKVSSVTLTGSSGLFESAMGTGFPKRGNYAYIQEKVKTTFYDPKIGTKELVDDVFSIVNDRNRAIRIIATAKSAVRHNLGDRLDDINVPVLLVWGKQDGITPPFVGEKFHELLPDSELHLIDKCGHAPMMEHPALFNQLLEDFLQRVHARAMQS